MTKQEQIEEMSDIIYRNLNMRKAAEALYNAGYKQEKEVAKELCEKIKTKFAFKIYQLVPDLPNVLDEILKEYGIELE